jgi:uncharacterized membrane protein YphA (DoxX/SURF4 family)
VGTATSPNRSSSIKPGDVASPPLARRVLAHARANCRAADLFRIGFGLIWVIDAAFKWQSGFRRSFMGMVMGLGQGQPGWMHGWFQFWVDFQHPHAMFFAYATAVIETVIALALIFGFARKSLYIIGALFSVTIWGTAEGFGGPYGASSTDIGAAVMYAVVFMGLLALNYEGGPSRFSVDYLLEQRVSWWHRIAEVEGRRHTGELLNRGPVTPITPAVADEPTASSTMEEPLATSPRGGECPSELTKKEAMPV